jgi:transcriptional regulator with XRE-family HTH domain
MTTGEQLFSDFRAEFESGARPNVADFLAEADDADRRALEKRIDLYLEEEAPLRSFDATEFVAAQETPVMKQAAALFVQAAETNLVAARERAGLTLEELAAAVLEKTGIGADEAEQQKAAGYLGQLEQGTLPRLTARVRDAVRSVLDTDPASSFARPEYGFAFRLSARDDVASNESIERAELLLDAMSTPSPRGWDEVDELFLSDD